MKVDRRLLPVFVIVGAVAALMALLKVISIYQVP